MESRIKVIGDNIITPLGSSSGEVFESLLSGRSEIQLHEGLYDLPEAFCGSILEREKIEDEWKKRYGDKNDLTFFERLCILSASEAFESSGFDPKGEETIFILSTTKGNVEYLEENLADSRAYLGGSAKRISEFFANSNSPFVVSNACISGVCAQILGVRLLKAGKYRNAVIIGADVLSRFIVSGFQSFKALSLSPCRPFDRDRAGLNLGEGAATIILSSEPIDGEEYWEYVGSGNHNDANHISGPSRTGEGSFRVLKEISESIQEEEIALISTHGTATPYNDEMESIAIQRVGLGRIPVMGLKGFLGHTLGAAGVIETILCMKALEKGYILPTKGFETFGTSRELNLSSEIRTTDKRCFIKILSGFGGCNAGIAYKISKGKGNGNLHEEINYEKKAENRVKREKDIKKRVRLTPQGVEIDRKKGDVGNLADLYRSVAGDYPKFFKMDMLCRLGFVAAEYLLKDMDSAEKEHLGVLLFNRESSLLTDRRYTDTIRVGDNYFPSPALFVYTLPNIVTGEIAIRHKMYGESAFYVMDKRDDGVILEIAGETLKNSNNVGLVTGWVDYIDEDNYEADLILL